MFVCVCVRVIYIKAMAKPELPPFVWPKSAAEIKESAAKVLEDAKANLDAVASAKELTFDQVLFLSCSYVLYTDA